MKSSGENEAQDKVRDMNGWTCETSSMMRKREWEQDGSDATRQGENMRYTATYFEVLYRGMSVSRD